MRSRQKKMMERSDEGKRRALARGELITLVLMACTAGCTSAPPMPPSDPSQVSQREPAEEPTAESRRVARAEEPDVIRLARQMLEFAPSRSDLTVGIAVFTVLAPQEDWTVKLPEAERDNLYDRGSWKILELKQAGPNRFELPALTIEATGANAGALCMSVKVWFNEVTNQYDSPFYVHVPDRYALVSFCTKDDPEARARHSQNRVAALNEFKERLKKPFALRLKENRVPWRPGIMVDNEGIVYFHSLIVGRPDERLYSTHLTGIWKLGANDELEELPLPDLRLRRAWPERVRKLNEDRFGTLATIAFSEPVALGVEGNLYATSYSPGKRGAPALYQVVRIDEDGDSHAIAGSVVGHQDGAAADAQFVNITALTVGAGGAIYVADGDIRHGSWIRCITPERDVTTIAGGRQVGFADGKGEAARFFTPSALAIDETGNLYVADPVNSRIRKVSPDGVVTTVAEDREDPFAKPTGVAIGPDGALFVLDGGPKMARVRKISADGAFETLVIIDER